MAYIGKSPTVGNFVKLDALTASATASYTMQLDSVNFSPESVNHMLVSLNGVIQAPTASYTISGSTITFASALTSSDSIDFIMVYGNVLDIGTPSDATISTAKIIDSAVTNAKLANSSITLNGSAVSLGGSATVGGNNTPRFYAYRNGNTSIANNTYTVVAYNAENFDSDSKFDTSTYRFTPTVAGFYYLAAQGVTDSVSGHNFHIVLRKNGSAILRAKTQNVNQSTVSFSVIVESDDNDYFDVELMQDSGGGRNILGGSEYNYFTGFKLL